MPSHLRDTDGYWFGLTLRARVVVYHTARGKTPAVVAAAAETPFAGGNTEQLGWVLYTEYLIPFEVASVLLLVAMVGAIVLAKREL